MTKVSKIDNISFYDKLHELIENNKDTKGLVRKIEGVIHFIKKAMDKNGNYSADSQDAIEALTFWKNAFEASLDSDPSWGIYIMNSRRKITINIRPIRDMILSNQWIAENEVENIIDHITNELLDEGNIQEYKEIRETLKQLQLFFNDFVPASFLD
jgi:uncharacterized alpha-E superfamily protein